MCAGRACLPPHLTLCIPQAPLTASNPLITVCCTLFCISGLQLRAGGGEGGGAAVK